jgi:hypothetical protein
MALRDAFVNIAKNAAAGAAQKMVSGVASSLRSGLGGSSRSTVSGPAKTNFKGEPPILMYPAGLGTDGRNLNYIMFTPMTTDNVKLKPNLGGHVAALFKNTDVTTKEEYRAAIEKERAEATARVRAAGVGKTSSIYLNSRVFTTTKSKRTIALYMPPQLNVSYGIDYAESEISGASEILYGIFKGYQSTGSFDDTIKNLDSGAAPEVLKGMAAKMVSGIPGLGGARDLYHMERGAIQTPKMELMFRGVARREFSFAFTFLPEDKIDGQTVQEIIREFKIRMHPKFDANAGSRKQTIPDIFEIAYHHTSGPNNNLHRIGKCFLKKMDVSYGGDQFQTFKSDGDDFDGAPVKTTISLTFGEISLIDKNMVSPQVGGY